MSRHILIAAVAGVALATASCHAEKKADEAEEIVEVPDSYGDVAVDGVATDQWCSDFGATSLDRLVEQTWQQNLDLKAAWARLEQSEAVVRESRAPLWPQMSVSASFNNSKQFIGNIDTPPGVDLSSDATSTFSVGAAASYEIDIWGKYRKRARAAALDRDAARAAAESLAITLTSQVAEAWFDVVAQRERIALLEAQIEVSEDYLGLTKMRFERGLATGLDLTQQQQNLESLRGQLATAQSRLQTSEHRLAVLTGRPPGTDIDIALREMPEMPALPDPGVPADLVEQRPDVRAALLRLKAADQRTAAEVADLLPTLRLSANVQYQAEEIANLFDSLFYNLAAEASQSVFEGGRRRAQVDRSEAVAEEQLYNYGQTLLGAMREVRDALVLEQQQTTFIESLEKQVESAQAALGVSRDRYRRGALSYLRVLTALQSLQQAERTLLDARRQQFSHRISLCRALGGTWTRDLESSIRDSDEGSTNDEGTNHE
ncbi:MAG: efflux transporter outer membrane subunit [Myxococcota bacterium]